MNTKEILEFVYKIVQIMNGMNEIIDILKCLYDINNQKEEKKGEPLHIKKRANACKTLTQNNSEKEIPPSGSDNKVNITIHDNANCNIVINVTRDKE